LPGAIVVPKGEPWANEGRDSSPRRRSGGFSVGSFSDLSDDVLALCPEIAGEIGVRAAGSRATRLRSGSVNEYYARRAAEYEATSWAEFDRREREAVKRFVVSLPAGRVLDIGCGTGYLMRLLRGRVVALDQSAEMLELAQARVPRAEFVCGEVPPLPFADQAFDLAFSSNVYSHIETAVARAEFVAEALRVARTLVVLEQAWRPGRERESWELRRLRDGSEHRVFKRYFTGDALARELDGVVAFASVEFLAVQTPA
jgi:SAM-dependent methyltransferase